jgi:threonine dehydratase
MVEHLNSINASLIDKVHQSIEPYILKTPLEFSPVYSDLLDAEVYLKLENLQVSGSFKYRGASAKIISEINSGYTKEFVTASTGNHAAGVATALSHFNKKGVIFLPETVTEEKLAFLEQFNQKLIIKGQNSMQTELLASQFATENNLCFIHPYNDPYVIAGQASIGREIIDQFPDIDIISGPIGGGGLISGISIAVKNHNCTIVGCQPENASEMIDSVKKGKIIDPYNLQTLCDATAGGIDPSSITLDIIKNNVSLFSKISEEDIFQTLHHFIESHYYFVEPSAILSLAGLFKHKAIIKNKKAAVIISGSKLDKKVLTN